MGRKEKDNNVEKLWKEYKKDEKNIELKNRLIETYYPLLNRIAYGLAKKLDWKIPPEELMSFGVDGLYRAIELFDFSLGVKFVTYASIRIKGSMIDGLRNEDIIPRSVRINYGKIETIKHKIEEGKKEKANEEEIIKELGIDPKEYYKNRKNFMPVLYSSLDNNYFEDGISDKYCNIKYDLNENLIDKKNNSPDFLLERKEFLSKLIGKDFSILEQKIVVCYFYEDKTMQMIADEIGMSEGRVSQIYNGVLPRMRDKIKRNPKFFNSYIRRIIASKCLK